MLVNQENNLLTPESFAELAQDYLRSNSASDFFSFVVVF